MKIALLAYNQFRNDARVEKAARTYADAGHDVRILALPDPEAGPDARVLRIDPRPSVVLRRRPAAGTHGGSFSLQVLRDRRRLYGYLWSVERVLLLWLRMAAALSSGIALWCRWRASARRGGSLRSLLFFADRVRGYRAFARHALRALDASGFRPDLVHANDFNTLHTAELLHERYGMPFIYDAHELWTGRNRGTAEVHPLEEPWELDTERRIARKALRVLTVSPSIARHLAAALGVPQPLLIRNVPYARDAQQPARGLRAALGLPAGTRLVLYTGKATYNRGIEDIIGALALLPAHVHFVVLGNYDAAFRRKVVDAALARHGLAGRFHQHGPVPSEEVPAWAADADLCVVPIRGAACLSYEYCLPNKLFEGIQAGLPVVATDLVDMRRTLEERECGLTYRSGDPADLRDRIARILEEPGLGERLRRNAVQAARALNWQNESQALLGVVQAVRPSRFATARVPPWLRARKAWQFRSCRRYQMHQYGALLETLAAGTQNLTLADMAQKRGDPGKPVLVVRHDIDHDLANALRIAAWEHARGVRATYCVLHSAWYYGHYDRQGLRRYSWVLDACRRLLELGHEINLHNNFACEALRRRRDPYDMLAEELAYLRQHGIPVAGTSTHGDSLCETLRFSNFEIFRECVYASRGGRRRIEHQGYAAELGARSMADFGLAYEAYDYPRDLYVTESGGRLRARQATRGRAGLRRGELEFHYRKVVGLTTHPIYWGWDALPVGTRASLPPFDDNSRLEERMRLAFD